MFYYADVICPQTPLSERVSGIEEGQRWDGEFLQKTNEPSHCRRPRYPSYFYSCLADNVLSFKFKNLSSNNSVPLD